MARDLKESIRIAEEIHNATYTLNEEKSKKVLEKIIKDIQERERDNIRNQCDCCKCKKYY